ncbi:trypsin-like peptidase domain-containing protein [Streptomyces sp. DSM 44915]|uniref:Trypsin-like peptidase domain-containing protein n=1 Tax=Streptomyces chisholmiae TaxID=3075540 RepID=A0ABU2JN24_9ACTN|nr:trypsin-like peptidase domain-containing protein [Streptomyces sp. DSM 44915]MDT0265643.1 trypsin-like peptidase domain-containing protein [Streptomyces sp. DSM 44915]
MTWGGAGGAQPWEGDAFELLAPLVAAATVRIHPPPRGYAEGEPAPPPWGSGFFVAPEWVLTCAHVALGGDGVQGGRREVGLTFRGVDRPVPGRVVWAQPDEPPPAGGMWPAPDLALVRLLGPPPPGPEGPGCVWLSERTARVFTRKEVAFFGAAEIAGSYVDISGRCTIKGEMGTEGLLRLGNEDEFPHGVSGGPVVDLERGEVIGVLKARRDVRDGGLAASVIQLRRLPHPGGPVASLADDAYQAVLHAHDAYHAERHQDADSGETTWTDVQSQLSFTAPTVLTPGQRVRLLGLFAALPPPVSTPQLDKVVGEVRGRPYEGQLPAPRAWRDGLGLLYDLRQGVTGLEAVLGYALYAATEDRPYPAEPHAEERLLRWVHRLAEETPTLSRMVRNRLLHEESVRLDRRTAREAPPRRDDSGGDRPLGPGPLGAPPGAVESFVLLQIVPRFWEWGRYDWRVCSAKDGGLAPIAEDFEASDLENPPERLRAALAEAFRRGDEPGAPVPLHVAVPYSLLPVAFERWRLMPDWPTLGERRPVVVRCTDPVPGAEDNEELAVLRRDRWAAVHRGPMLADVLDCHDQRARPLPEPAALIGREMGTVPVLCRTPSSGGEPAALHRVMASGYNVVLWRRELAARGLWCEEFHDGVVGAVQDAGRAGWLPSALWRLREAAADGTAHAAWAADVALLYADPAAEPLDGDYLEAP